MGRYFTQLESFLRKKLSNSWTAKKSKTLQLNSLTSYSVYLDLLFLARLTFLSSLPVSLYIDKPSYLPKDHGYGRWMLSLTQLASTSLCTWDICSEFMTSYWIRIILDNWSLFFKYHIASDIVMCPASYIKPIDACWLFTEYSEAF